MQDDVIGASVNVKETVRVEADSAGQLIADKSDSSSTSSISRMINRSCKMDTS